MGEGPERGGSSQACRPLLKKIIYRYITAISCDDNTEVNGSCNHCSSEDDSQAEQ